MREGGNYPRWELSGGQLSQVEIVWGAIFQGVIVWGDRPGGNCSGGIVMFPKKELILYLVL